MEERTLRSHLITIYVVTIAGILAAMLAVVLLLSARELEQKNRENFQTLVTAIWTCRFKCCRPPSTTTIVPSSRYPTP